MIGDFTCTLWLFNIKWAIYTMAMFNNQTVYVPTELPWGYILWEYSTGRFYGIEWGYHRIVSQEDTLGGYNIGHNC
jgi:pimeloyl-CoA synthetase